MYPWLPSAKTGNVACGGWLAHEVLCRAKHDEVDGAVGERERVDRFSQVPPHGIQFLGAHTLTKA